MLTTAGPYFCTMLLKSGSIVAGLAAAGAGVTGLAAAAAVLAGAGDRSAACGGGHRTRRARQIQGPGRHGNGDRARGWRQ